MSRLVPINKHLEIEPVENQAFMASAGTFEEKGKIVSLAPDCTWFHEGYIGRIVYFDSWTAAKFSDSEGKVHYLVEEQNVRAFEAV